jgi:hypothetical protein
MRFAPTVPLSALLLSFATDTSLAQGSVATAPGVASYPGVEAHVAAGYAEPLGHAGETFDAGWTLAGGVTFHPIRANPLGLRLDAGYARFGARRQVIHSDGYPLSARVDDGELTTTHLTLDALHEFGRPGHFGGYVGLGIGGYHEDWTVTETVLVGGVSCDPFSGLCLISGGGEVIETDQRVTRFGWNVSGAVIFPVGSKGGISLEVRYHSIKSDPATEIFPVLVGYRW